MTILDPGVIDETPSTATNTTRPTCADMAAVEKRPSTEPKDLELEQLRVIVGEMLRMDHDAWERVLRYLNARFGMPPEVLDERATPEGVGRHGRHDPRAPVREGKDPLGMPPSAPGATLDEERPGDAANVPGPGAARKEGHTCRTISRPF